MAAAAIVEPKQKDSRDRESRPSDDPIGASPSFARPFEGLERMKNSGFLISIELSADLADVHDEAGSFAIADLSHRIIGRQLGRAGVHLVLAFQDLARDREDNASPLDESPDF